MSFIRNLYTLLIIAAIAVSATAGERPTSELIKEFQTSERTVKRSEEQLQAVHTRLLDALLPDLKSKDVGVRTDAERIHHRICSLAGRPGAEAEREATCKAILDALNTKLPPRAVACLLGGLEITGTDETIEPVAALLDSDDEIARERARRVLQANPADEAAEHLRTALKGATDTSRRIALINTLGARRDKGSLDLLIKCARDESEDVRTEAVQALARLEDTEAVDVIAEASHKVTTPRTWLKTVSSYLSLADSLAEKGDRALALKMYKKLLNAPGQVQCAAVIGLGRAGGPAQLPHLFKILKSDNPQLQGAARSALALMPVEVLTAAVSQKTGKITPKVKVELLNVLADHGDSTVLPTLIKTSSDDNKDVRIAAYRGMGRLGDSDAIDTLLAAVSKTEVTELDAVRTAITSIPGTAVDNAIVEAMDGAPSHELITLIRLLGERSAHSAVSALIKAASHKDDAVRTEAIKALGVFAGQPALKPLLELLVKADSRDIPQITESLASIRDRVENADVVASAISEVMPSVGTPARCELLRVLGPCGGDTALGELRKALASGDSKITEAALHALADWPDAKPAPALLKVAGETKKLLHKVLALRAYVRMVGLPTERPVGKTLKMYKDAMQIAERPNEKKLVLGGIGDVSDVRALQMVEPCLSDEALQVEAAVATIKIAKAIAEKNPDAAARALRKVLDTPVNKDQRKEAEAVLKGIE